MPPRPHRVCLCPGCNLLTQERNGFCLKHQEYAEKREQDRLEKARVTSESRRGSSTQRGYDSKWRKAREAFLKENPFCAEHLKLGQYIPATVVDHIEPHKGDLKLFWNRRNWQSLCRVCHNRKTWGGR